MNDMSPPNQLPATQPERDITAETALASFHRTLTPSLQIMLDGQLYKQVRTMAVQMAEDTVFTPRWLQGKPAACHTVINMALNSNLDPNFVARCTYQTPGGSIGFFGKLVQAVLEQSGRFIGAPEITYTGDWAKVAGKFEKRTSQKGNDFVVPTWTAKDAEGCGITVRWRVKGEETPRVWPSEGMPFYLTQCFPLNSPLWATDPATQIRYLALRRFADQAAPGILGGMPFDTDDLFDASERARDVTGEAPPRPTRETVASAAGPTVTDVEEEPVTEVAKPFSVVDMFGEVTRHANSRDACEDWVLALDYAEKQQGERGLTAVWESNTELYAALDENGAGDLYEKIRDIYGKRREAAAAREQKAAAPKPAQGASAGATQGGEPAAATTAPPKEQATTAPSARAGSRPTTQGPSASADTARSGAAGTNGADSRKGGGGQNVTAGASPSDQHVPFPDDPPTQVGEGSVSGGMGLGVPDPKPETAGPAPEGGPRDPIWEKTSRAIAPPTDLAGRIDWISYGNHLRDLVEEARDYDELNGLFRDNADSYAEMAVANPVGHQRVLALAGQRQDEFAAVSGE